MKYQIEMLIKESKYFKASLTKEQREKSPLTQECKQLQGQLEEIKQSTRQKLFTLSSRLKRLQHTKLAADQGCLHLSLRQERLAVYEQQSTVICQRMINTIRTKVEETHSLLGVASTKCTNNRGHFSWGVYPADSNGMAMYEAHCHLESCVVEMINRFEAAIKLVSKTKKNNSKDYLKKESVGFLGTIEIRPRVQERY